MQLALLVNGVPKAAKEKRLSPRSPQRGAAFGQMTTLVTLMGERKGFTTRQTTPSPPCSPPSSSVKEKSAPSRPKTERSSAAGAGLHGTLTAEARSSAFPSPA